MVENDDKEQTITYLDKDIAALEAQLPKLEAEKARLLAGVVEVQGLGDGQLMQVDLSQLVAIQDKDQRNKQLQALLTDSSVFNTLQNAYRNKDAVRQDMVAAGILPNEALNLDAKAKVLIAGRAINQNVQKATKLSIVSKLWKSPWLLIGGLIFLLIGGGASWLFYFLASGNGNAKGSNNNSNSAPTPALTARAVFSTEPALTPGGKGPGIGISDNLKVGYSYSYSYANSSSYFIASSSSVTNSTFSSLSSSTDQAQTTTVTPQPVTPTPTLANTPTPPTAPSPTVSGATPPNQGQDYNRVGQPPTDLGGLNGPHGAFMAPSLLAIPALGVNVGVMKAIVQEQVIQTPTATPVTSVETLTPSPAPTSSTTTTANRAPTVGVSVVWSRPGEVLHLGAYPGEVGNCIILGTQDNLAPLRRLEQNDEIKLTDRNKNVFTYRVVAFSATGQPERIVNPTWSGDNWIFQPDTQGQALLTIVVSMPQPLPPVDPNNGSNTGSPNTNTGQNSATGANSSPGGAAAKDDFTVGAKLAYRAVLVGFAPIQQTPGATPVPVNGQVWHTQPLAVPHLTLEPTATPTPTPSPSVPTVTPPAAATTIADNGSDNNNALLAMLVQAAAMIARSGTTMLPTPVPVPVPMPVPTTPTPQG